MLFINFLRKRNLKFKILLAFIGILILPLCTLMILSLKKAEKVAQTDFNRRLGYAAKLFRESLSEQMETAKIRTKKVADMDFFSLAAQGFPKEETMPSMERELIRSGLDYIAIIEDKNQVLLSQGAPPFEALKKIIPAICHSPLSVNFFIINEEPWIFSAALITKLRSKVSKHVIFAQRLRRDYADKLKRLTGAEFSLIYANKLILTTKMSKYGKRKTGEFPDKPDIREGSIEVLGKSHYFVREEVLRGKVSEAIALEISLPNSEYNVLGKSLRKDFVLFGVLGLVLALITGSFLSYHIASPINQLAENTTKISEGDLSFNKTSSRKDEIGTLTNNFQGMVVNLKAERDLKHRRMNELNTLFEISNAVNFFTDSEELLKFVLTHSIDVLEAERGSIMLLDDQTDELVVKVASGGRYRIVSGTPVKLGQGVCGTVAKEGAGKICNDGFKNPNFKNFGSLLPVEDIQSLICSPLKFKEGTIGVINIVNKRNSARFNENDLALLNLIASQAAVTIENNKLYELSITDGMTKLYVHRYFQARLSEEMLRARRYGLTLSLIMIDIDNFKKFNDTYGHQTGDDVLIRVAQSIKDTIRTGIDIPCRYGGEEMSVILPETRSDEAYQTAERLRESINAITIHHPTGDLKITASIGIGSYPNDAHDKPSLIKVADKALYYSKGNGKNQSTSASTLLQKNIET